MAKQHDCRKCARYDACADVDKCRNRTMMTEIQRAGDPKRKHRIDIQYMHELPETESTHLERTIYGDHIDL